MPQDLLKVNELEQLFSMTPLDFGTIFAAL